MRFFRRGDRDDPSDADDEAAGWDSIESAFAAVYGTEPRHVAPDVQPPFAGGILNGISAYRRDAHWHFVTFGLTDLFSKTPGGDPATSGWGYELTLVTPPSEEPPSWAWALLLGIARTTVEHSEIYEPGVRLGTGPIPTDDSPLTAVAFCLDPLVQPSVFPFGEYRLLRAVGVTTEERDEMKASGTDVVLDRIRASDPMLCTDPDRPLR